MSRLKTQQDFRIEWDLHELADKPGLPREQPEPEMIRAAFARALAAGDIAASNAEVSEEQAA